MQTPPQVEEKDFAYEAEQSTGMFLGQNLRPKARPRRRGTMLSELRSPAVGNTTDESGTDEDETNVKQQPAISPAHTLEYVEFINSSKNLEKTLDSFTHTVQRLGSALGLSRASSDVRMELESVRTYFENTAQHLLGVLVDEIKSKRLAHARMKRKKRTRRMQQSISTQSDVLAMTYQNNISDALDKLASAIVAFKIALTDFEDYCDRDGLATLINFELQVLVLSDTLSYFGSDGDSPELRRFVYEKTMSMKKHLDETVAALNRFVDIGIPCISYAQKRSNNMLLNAATVATFFAGVAATTLQFSIDLNDNSVQVAANTLWFASLVLSIGSAVNGILSMTWRQAVFSSPKRTLPWIIRFWLRKGYLVLLVASVLAFLGGLLCFMFQTQKPVSSWIATGCTVLCVFGLVTVSVWFVMERWDFTKFRKQLQTGSAGYDGSIKDWIRYQMFWFRVWLDRVFGRRRIPRVRVIDGETNGGTLLSRSTWSTLLRRFMNTLHGLPSRLRGMIGSRPHGQSESESAHDDESKDDKPPSIDIAGPALSECTSRERFVRPAPRNALDTVLLEEFIQNVRNMNISQPEVEFDVDHVKHMQFSPDGKWFVVCFRRACVLYRFAEKLEYYQHLRHTRRPAKQAEWSPDGSRLLTRMKDSVRIWSFDEEQVCRPDETIGLYTHLKWVRWVNDDEFLALSENSIQSSIQRINMNSAKIIGTNLPSDIEIHEMYPLPGGNGDVVLLIATRLAYAGFEPTSIDCILVYNLNTIANTTAALASVSAASLPYDFSWEDRGRIELKIPLLYDVESLTVCEDGQHILVSYEGNSPELWRYVTPAEDARKKHSLTRLAELLIPEYEANSVIGCAWGDAVFLGPTYDIVACPADDRVFFWNILTRERIHSLYTSDMSEGEDSLQEFSWAVSSPVPILVTASGKMGGMRVWIGRGSRTGSSSPIVLSNFEADSQWAHFPE